MICNQVNRIKSPERRCILTYIVLVDALVGPTLDSVGINLDCSLLAQLAELAIALRQGTRHLLTIRISQKPLTLIERLGRQPSGNVRSV